MWFLLYNISSFVFVILPCTKFTMSHYSFDLVFLGDRDTGKKLMLSCILQHSYLDHVTEDNHNFSFTYEFPPEFEKPGRPKASLRIKEVSTENELHKLVGKHFDCRRDFVMVYKIDSKESSDLCKKIPQHCSKYQPVR
ncbi:hypothetical protein EAF04_007703 [Stromatinia cepivora]|nr:hypothetical protein EAF04_007703 [Stromatinia cepivora]